MLEIKAKIIKVLFLFWFCSIGLHGFSQNKIKEIAFHLYTDSLKKGTYNYINVDALLENEKWLPMDTSHIGFTSSEGEWFGNNLVVDTSFSKDSVVVKSFLKSNPINVIQTVIYIKKNKDPDVLPSMQQVMPSANPRRRKN